MSKKWCELCPKEKDSCEECIKKKMKSKSTKQKNNNDKFN